MEKVYCVIASALVAVMCSLSGCSVRYELGWHGLTGRDDRTQTQLVHDTETDPKDKKRY